MSGTKSEIEMDYGVIPEDVAIDLDAMKRLVSIYYKIQDTRIGIGHSITSLIKEYGDPSSESEGENQETKTKKPKTKLVRCSRCGTAMSCPKCESIEAAHIKDMTPIERVDDVYNISSKIESYTKRQIIPILKKFDIYNNWLNHVVGVGEVISAGLISGIKYPGRFVGHTKQPPVKVSALWHYCGLHVENGKSPTRQSGHKVTWNPFMRELCWKLGESFVKTKGYYRRCYDMFKDEEVRKSEQGMVKAIDQSVGFVPYDQDLQKMFMEKFECPACGYREDNYLASCPECGRKAQPIITKQRMERLKQEYGNIDIKTRMTNAHIHERAKRKTVKLFLAHLLQVWCDMEGVDIAEPYAKTILGHENIINPPMPDASGRI